MLVFQRISAILLLFAIVGLFVGCGDDEARLRSDSEAAAFFNKAANKVGKQQKLTPEEFEELKKLYSVYPNSEAVTVLYEKALLLRKDWPLLIAFYKSDPTFESNPVARKSLAKIYVRAGMYEDGYKLASQFDFGSNSDMRRAAGISLFKLGKYPEAKKVFEAHKEKIEAEKSFDEMVFHGLIYFYEGENDKAIEILEKVIDINPADIKANNALARIYSSSGEKEKANEATKRLQESYDILTETEQVKIRRVERLYQLQDHFKAKRYEEVIVLGKQLLPDIQGPNKITIYRYLYEAYQATGKAKEAREILETINQLQKK
ncbi:MAG: tetratricopeptide repeat protein [Pyrinomonadaceae bacterium]|nr:tetratricopeptide repeat protein [Pyrinomonadaceae bacterium]